MIVFKILYLLVWMASTDPTLAPQMESQIYESADTCAAKVESRIKEVIEAGNLIIEGGCYENKILYPVIAPDPNTPA